MRTLVRWVREAYLYVWDDETGEIRWCIGNRAVCERDHAEALAAGVL
jgi:hypothetical protein